MASENGTLAKLTEYRHAFLAGFEEASKQFQDRLQVLREDYLNKVVDATLTDPRLGDVQRALAWRTTVAQTAPTPAVTTTATEGAVPIPEKFPMKRFKANCPKCGFLNADVGAQFCSRCGTPMFF